MNRTGMVAVARQDATLPTRRAARELRTALDQLFVRAGRRVAAVITRPLPYASSFAIDEVDVRFDDGGAVALVCKDLGDRGILPEARGVKPGFLRDPLREIAVYESILEPAGVGAPRCYGRRIDPQRGRYWLFLERIAGPPLSEVGDFGVWRQAGEFLARMHADARLRASLAAAADWVPLLRYDAAFHRRWMRRALRFHIDWPPVDPERRERLSWLAARYDAIVDEIDALPKGFVHGEFYASNVLVERARGEARVRPVDWELAGIGSPVIDVAAFTAGWKDEPRRELASSYHAQLDRGDPCWLPFDAFMRALDCCRVELAVRCLGWARRWSPPRPHARDWLAEAVRAAERIAP